MALYFFIANVKLDEGNSFYDEVEVIFNRGGAEELKEFLYRMIEMLEGFQGESAN
ncbi:hypothetical protein N8500_05370 [Candidatus Puniceispirillum sp.]|nr:hypothetical protein [Candidatus Puniceispirillum sp.]